MSKRKHRLLLVYSVSLLIAALIAIYLFSPIIPPPDPDTDPEVQESLTELNLYLKSQSQPEVSLLPIKQISNYELHDKVQKQSRLVILDIRERYELEINRLPDNYNIKYIRLGDILNNSLDISDKDSPIVVISFGNNRAYQAAAYLLSKGYSNISILNGGISKWSLDNFPMAINNYQNDKDITQTINFIDKSDEHIKNSVTLHFGPVSDPKNIQSNYWSSKFFDQYINTLDPNKLYVISCNNRKDCYNALFFWHKARSTINIVGYTNNT